MSLKGKVTEEQNRILFTAEFSNGTVSQLEELASFLKEEGFDIPDNNEERLTAVVQYGIAWLETLKKRKDSTK